MSQGAKEQDGKESNKIVSAKLKINHLPRLLWNLAAKAAAEMLTSCGWFSILKLFFNYLISCHQNSKNRGNIFGY
jgi:hypothetical protein